MPNDSNIYWCNIPSDLLAYSSSIIPDGAKLLFGVLFNLSKKKRYCYCSNKYLCKTLNISDRSVNRYLYVLETNAYIQIKPNPQDRRSRLIYIAQERNNCYLRVDAENHANNQNSNYENDDNIDIGVYPGYECPKSNEIENVADNLSVDYVENATKPDNLSVDSVDNSIIADNLPVENTWKIVGNSSFVKNNRQFEQFNRQFGGQNNNINNINNSSSPSSIDEVKDYVKELEKLGIGIALKPSKFYRFWNDKNWEGIDGVRIENWQELYKHCNHKYKKKQFGIF